MKNWIFDHPFNKKGPVLVILGLGMIQDQEENWALEAVEASEVAEAAELNEAGYISRAWKITMEDF